MITPRFSCDQTPTSVIISIYCPSIRASDVEINVDETLVTVHVNPYFLRLNFSNPLIEDDSSSAKYDASSGYLIVTLTKENPGEDFKDLDLLAKLLAPRPTATANAVGGPSIEVLASSTSENENTTDQEGADDLASHVQSLSLEDDELLRAEQNDWQLPQTISEEPISLKTKQFYGFLDMHSGYLRHASHTENEVNELGDGAETLTISERRRARIKHEETKWDEEHYLADFMDDEMIQELLHWDHPVLVDDKPVEYTEEEKLTMLRLPRKEYLVSAVQTHDLYLTLITLLFSYAYDARTTQHDPTPESAWTICNLTAAFSALDPPRSDFPTRTKDVFVSPSSSSTSRMSEQNPDTTQRQKQPLGFSDTELVYEALVPSYKRSLIFPLYRSWVLAEQCQKDVARILKKGKRTVVRCLLEMKDILDHSEVYYLYSKIWVDDFCVWIQTDASDEVLQALGARLLELKVDKKLMGWDLEELERSAQETLEREPDSDDE